jgi:elongation factor Ts
MAITAAEVNKLRQETGAGMMDCKKALEEAAGNFEEAIVILRKKGMKVSANRADRETKEGIVIVRMNEAQNQAIVFGISCETDFVAKNQEFINFANSIGDAAHSSNAATADDLMNVEIDGIKISDRLIDYTGKIGEKITVMHYNNISGNSIVPYIHSNSKLGVLVVMNSEKNDAIIEAGKDVAMQIAAMNPVALDKDGVSAEVVEREIEIGKDLARQEGKPEAMIEKIAMGRLNKFYQDSTLLNQSYIKDGSMNVAQMLEKTQKGLTVTKFLRISVG